jgi:hypothetical protein
MWFKRSESLTSNTCTLQHCDVLHRRFTEIKHCSVCRLNPRFFQVKDTAPEFAALTHIKNSFYFSEMLGNTEKEKQASCGVFSIEGGKETTLKVPSDGFNYIIEGGS